MAITNKESLVKRSKTRLELLEDRIAEAEKSIEAIKSSIGNQQSTELTKLQKVVDSLKTIRADMTDINNKEEIIFDNELSKIREESVLIVNIDKIKILEEKEKLEKELKEYKETIGKLQKEVAAKASALESEKIKNSKLNEANTVFNDNIDVLKSKAYGYDIAKKYEQHRKNINLNESSKFKQLDSDKMAYNYWERENYNDVKNPTRLEELAKEKQLWISNPSGNINKLISDIDSKKVEQGYVNNPYGRNLINSNMRKYSPMILSTSQNKK
jgi:hypothetical protein